MKCITEATAPRCVFHFGLSSKGSPDRLDLLRAFTRRIIAIELQATFSSDPDRVSIDDRTFAEDSTLGAFLDSPEVRVAYIQSFLLPYIMENSAEDCRRTLLNPPSCLVAATRRLVAQMANGGIEPASEALTEEQEKQRIQEASEIVIQAFVDAQGKDFVKKYDVAKVMKSLPGTHKAGTKGTLCVSQWDLQCAM